MMILLPRGPWCCEKGEALRVTVCPECAEESAAYQSCLGSGDEGYAWFVHPDMERDMRAMWARDKWVVSYRLWRQAGKPPATPQQILAGDYSPRLLPVRIADADPELHRTFFADSEFGSIEGFRFITPKIN